MTEPVFTSEEYMRASRIGPLRRQPGPIVLVDYDAAWPALFERVAERVRAVLGDRVLRIEHAGSTSVPGLCAKPIVDIVLEEAGYVLRIREPDWFEHRLFKGPDTDINMHTFSAACSEVERMLLFRDWLRAQPAEADLYARTKRELAQREWDYVQHYADAKTAVVREII